MTTKEQYLLETWPKQQAKGKLTYMAFHALFYSVIVGAISLLFRIGDAPIIDIIFSKEYLIKLVLFTAIGLVIANYKWNANNKKYDELKQQSKQGPIL